MRGYDLTMVPETSTALLKNVASGADGSRWPEFVARYRPMMTTYLKVHFPAVDADDVVQETLIALSKVLPNYRYAPEETGHFRNYLTGILRNKALRWCEKEEQNRALKFAFRENAILANQDAAEVSDAAWREAMFEIAMRQLLSDERISGRSKQIFQRVAVDGIAPDDVAAAYGTSRNNVDKTKSRMIARLREIVRALETAGDE